MYSIVYVCENVTAVVFTHAASFPLPLPVALPSYAVYLYVHITWPSHAGAVDEPTNTGVTVLPHASIIFAGAPGFTASAGHDTVEVVLVGAVKPPMYSIVYVCVHVAVVVPSHAV